jgi:hypothetical protein
MSSILEDRQLLDLLNQVEVAADELTCALDGQSIPEEVRDAIRNGTRAMDDAAEYLLRLREQNHINENTKPRLVSIIDGNVCAGFLVNRGVCGVEAFDKDEKSLGVFYDVLNAASAVTKSAALDTAGSAP